MDKKQDDLKKWHAVMAQYAASGRTIPAFCSENQLPVWQFCYWRRKLQHLERLPSPSRLELLPVSSSSVVPVSEKDPLPVSSPDSGIAIQTKGLQIHLTNDFDGTALKRVLEITGGLPC